MSDNAEEGIMRSQLAGKDGVAQHQKTSSLNLFDRFFTYLFMIGFVGLAVVWATATSPYITYGSLLLGILGIVLYGVLRVRQIQRLREERARQVQQVQSGTKN